MMVRQIRNARELAGFLRGVRGSRIAEIACVERMTLVLSEANLYCHGPRGKPKRFAIPVLAEDDPGSFEPELSMRM